MPTDIGAMQKALRITKVDSNATVFRLPPEGSSAQSGPGKPLDPLGCYLHPWASPTEAVKATVPCLHAKVAMSKQPILAKRSCSLYVFRLARSANNNIFPAVSLAPTGTLPSRLCPKICIAFPDRGCASMPRSPWVGNSPWQLLGHVLLTCFG